MRETQENIKEKDEEITIFLNQIVGKIEIFELKTIF
ncbi:MAG: hypothetical protein KR126chlam4_01158 [Candidatus Anoxychlamydiales bacterium]|nr:hypothetical protein [Candidatus Anoxychlamydiales bacterium]NGX41319.1 hypothetical protein [Candidatus Anoxychlamydiales bacterium]